MSPSSSHLLLVGFSILGALQVFAFAPTAPIRAVGKQAIVPLFALSTEEEKKAEEKTEEKSSLESNAGADPDVEGLPWWWELVWKLDMMKKGTEGEPIIFGDSANVLRTNIEQIYGGYDSLDGCPLAGTRVQIFSSV